MTQQDIYYMCMDYGALVEVYWRQKLEDIRDGVGPDDQLAAMVLRMELDLQQAGVNVSEEQRRQYVQERINEALKGED